MILKVIGILLVFFGFFIVVIGLILWKKQKVRWVSVHANVKEKNIAAFTRMVGQSTVGIGISVVLLGIFQTIFLIIPGIIIFGIIFVISMAVYFRAQSLYD